LPYTKLKNIIKKLYNMKVIFYLPPKKNILVYDEIPSSILKKIIKKDFDILKIHKIEIYFWIFIKQIIFLDFTLLTYYKNYIKYTSPKIIITFNDTKNRFYDLSDIFKNITFITVQSGLRDEADFKNYFKSKKLKCDHFFVLNKHIIKEYKKFIKSKYHILGRFSNNIVKVKKTTIFNKFLLISQYEEKESNLKNFYKKLMSYLNIYFSSSNKKLHVLLRSKSVFRQKKEIEFYKKIFQFDCVFHKVSEWKKSYEILDKFENIIFMHSTLGYEAISRRKKVAMFQQKKIVYCN
jgi:surface carbohydrate biosynthesis protein